MSDQRAGGRLFATHPNRSQREIVTSQPADSNIGRSLLRPEIELPRHSGAIVTCNTATTGEATNIECTTWVGRLFRLLGFWAAPSKHGDAWVNKASGRSNLDRDRRTDPPGRRRVSAHAFRRSCVRVETESAYLHCLRRERLLPAISLVFSAELSSFCAVSLGARCTCPRRVAARPAISPRRRVGWTPGLCCFLSLNWAVPST